MTDLITLASGERCTEEELRAAVRAVVLEVAPNPAGAAVEVVSVATPTVSVALLLSPPAQALMTAVLAAIASVMKRILEPRVLLMELVEAGER
jgi:hypothetical protein